MDWDDIFSRIAALERLVGRRVDDLDSLDKIAGAAAELEQATVDEVVSDYAREIRIAAGGNQLPLGRKIADTILGERIERLANHCRIAFAKAALADGRATSS